MKVSACELSAVLLGPHLCILLFLQLCKFYFGWSDGVNSPYVSQYSTCTVSIVVTVLSGFTVMFIRCHTFQLQLCCTVTEKAAAAVLEKKTIIRLVGTLPSFLTRRGGLRSSCVAKVNKKGLDKGNAQDELHTSERGTSKWCARHTFEDGRQSTHTSRLPIPSHTRRVCRFHLQFDTFKHPSCGPHSQCHRPRIHGPTLCALQVFAVHDVSL